MINEERVRHMTAMAIFEKEMGPEYQPMLKYTKKEYIALHGWGGFLAGTLIYAVVFHYEGILASGHELHQAGMDALEGFFAEGFLATEDAVAVVVEVEHVAHGFVLVHPLMEEVVGAVAVLGVGLDREGVGESVLGELAEETLS